jgi:E3 ubiquitin-protein ligase DOA10
MPDTHAGGDAIDLLRDILEDLSVDIWQRASEYAEGDDRKTVQEADIRQAYSDIFESQDMIFQAAADLEDMKSDFEEYLIDSPMASRGEDDG